MAVIINHYGAWLAELRLLVSPPDEFSISRRNGGTERAKLEANWRKSDNVS
jgi:hypothetical protein